MAKPRSVLESMTVTLLEITNEDDSSAGHCSDVRCNGSIQGEMEASIYLEKPLEVTFIVGNYLIRWR